MADEALNRALRSARDQFLASRDIPSSVRADIAASWRRSALHGLAPDRLAALYDGDLVDLTGRFAVSARPVADRLGDDLADTGVTLLLADEQARLIDRRVSDAGLRARLDTSLVAPGFRHGEQHVGTNAIGTSLQQRSPAVVTGTEHFADTFSALACAAAPVIDARSGQVVGAIGLTCPAEIASALMLPFVKRAAFAIEQRLVAGSATADHALLRRFLQARRQAKGPLVSVNQHVMHTNTAAARIVNPADQEMVWTWACHAVAGQAQAESELYLASGLPVLARARPVHEGGVLAGALVRMEPQIPVVPPALSPARVPRQADVLRQASGASHAGGESRARGAAPGWASLTETERSVAEIIAEGATNRDAAARLFLSPHTIDYHLRQIFRKLAIGSRVELTRLVVQHAGSGNDEGLAAGRQPAPAAIRRPPARRGSCPAGCVTAADGRQSVGMKTMTFQVRTGRSESVHDITARCAEFARESAAGGGGLLHVFVPHATAGVALIELGAGSDADLLAALSVMLPADDRWQHAHGSRGHGRSHVLPAFVAPFTVLPVVAGSLALGTWQSVALVDLNVDNPDRQVRLSFLG